MEPQSNASHLEHSAFSSHPNLLSGNQVDHGHLPSALSIPSAYASFPRSDRQSYSTDSYSKDTFSRDGYVRESFSARESFGADKVNFGGEAFARDRESLSKDADAFHSRDTRLPYPRDTENCLSAAFDKDKDSLINDERSRKKVKRSEARGWWHESEGGDRPPETPKEMESNRKAEEVGGPFVNSVGSLGAFRGVGVGGRGLNVVGGGTVGGMMGSLSDGCGEVEVGIVVGARGGSADGEVGGDIGDGGLSCGGTALDGDLGDEADGEGRDGDSRDKGDKDGSGKKKRAELWQDAEMDALVSAYRQIHMKLAVAGKKGKHVFKSANEKWKEVRNLLLPLNVDRQPKEIERKWSNLSTAFKQIADWNKKVGRPSYWELDEISKKEKTKAKELPATFRVQLYEAMAEFLGDRTAARRSRGWTQYDGPDRASLMMGPGNGVSGGSEGTSGIVDIPLPMEKLASQPSVDMLDQKRPRVVLVAPGSYNPPTYMHLRMFEIARDALISDGYEVLGGYMSPVNDAYGKKGLAAAEHRIRLCQLASNDSPFIMVDSWEAKQTSYQRTLTVLSRVDHAVNTHGFARDEKVRVMLLCGADLLESFTTPGVWIPDQVQALCNDHGVICIPREGKDVRKFIFEHDLLYEQRRNIVIVDECITTDISSTKLRRNLGRGLSIKYLTSDSVINYIKMHHLYDPNQF